MMAKAGLEGDAIGAQKECSSAILEVRLALGLTQAEFSKVFKIMQRLFSDLENGHGNPGLETLEKIARPLGFAIGFVPEANSDER
jgi:putative transcriptional regulator